MHEVESFVQLPFTQKGFYTMRVDRSHLEDVIVRLPGLRRRYFLRGTKRSAHKVFRNAILGWGSLKKRLCRSIVFQVGIQEVQRVERNQGMTRVGVIPSVIGYLIFRKALRALPALKHRTE
jgi:hypothetical protein